MNTIEFIPPNIELVVQLEEHLAIINSATHIKLLKTKLGLLVNPLNTKVLSS